MDEKPSETSLRKAMLGWVDQRLEEPSRDLMSADVEWPEMDARGMNTEQQLLFLMNVQLRELRRLLEELLGRS